MLIGVPKEIKNHEYRVGVTPSGVRELLHHGHRCIVQSKAGFEIGYEDSQYQTAGALIAETAEEVYARADMIVKVKEPQPQECMMLREGQVIFCYLHLAPDPRQAELLMQSGAIAIAFETVTAPDNSLPLLAPMSEVAGRLSIQAGSFALEKSHGGRGVLLGGVPGVPAADVVILGAGVVGTNAALMAKGLSANVTIIDKSIKRLKEIDLMFQSQINTVYATVESIEHHVMQADLIVGAVLIPGASAPRLVTKKMLSSMRRGAVLVDVSIDQGGCFETSHPTTHDDPLYTVDGIVHYCVANMPAAVARTSTQALENATLPYTIALADKGYRSALREDTHFRNGLNVHRGKITHEAVAQALNHAYVPAGVALG
jgi:alanine dehydrogenase